MTESSFIKAVHRHVSKSVKVWKIIDDFHGGVSDVVYFGTEGRMLFVEYKFTPTLPVRPTTIPARLKLKPQQHLWFTDLEDRDVPVAAIYGVGQPKGGVWIEDRDEGRDGITKYEILERLQSHKDLATRINTHVLGDIQA